jgi:PKHD-type hydroxylase
MNGWWRAFYNQLTPAECNQVIEYGLTHTPVQGTIGHGGGTTIVQPDFRQSTVRWFKRSDPKLHWLYLRMEDMALQANAISFGFDIAGFRDVQFTEYDGAKKGHYDWHEDNCWKGSTPYDRKLSMVIQLSDPTTYKGGQLELQNDPFHNTPGNKVLVNQGDVIVFPSHNRHRVTDVTEGMRYSLVTWFIGPRFR